MQQLVCSLGTRASPSLGLWSGKMICRNMYNREQNHELGGKNLMNAHHSTCNMASGTCIIKVVQSDRQYIRGTKNCLELVLTPDFCKTVIGIPKEKDEADEEFCINSKVLLSEALHQGDLMILDYRTLVLCKRTITTILTSSPKEEFQYECKS